MSENEFCQRHRTPLCRLLLLPVIFLSIISIHLQLVAQQYSSDDSLAQQVFQSLLRVSPSQSTIQWPPALKIIDKPDINAFATIEMIDGKPQSIVVCYRGLLQKVVQGDPNKLAYVLGHELAHHILGHTRQLPAQTDFLRATFTRTQELEADHRGMELSLQAGYSYDGGLSALRKMIDLGLNYSSFEGLSSDHPSWYDRIAQLDKSQAGLWRSLSAFENGTYFLMVQNYPLAERSFRQVTKAFPSSDEAWANLGYALLMEYIDSLDESAIRNFDVGQVVIGGFYRQSKSLEGQIRGINEELWWDSVGALREAIRLNPSLSLPKANLGVAYLFRPAGKDPGRAAEYLEEASGLAANDQSLDPVARLAEQTNLAVAYEATGNSQKALLTLGAIESSLEAPALSNARNTFSISSALAYNRAFLLADSQDPKAQTIALEDLKHYLRQTAPGAVLWKTAYTKYSDLSKKMGVAPESESTIFANDSPHFRPIESLQIDKAQVALGDDFIQLKARMQAEDRVSTLIPNTNLARIDYPDMGIGVIGTDQVLAFVLQGGKAPAITLKETGFGTKTSKVYVGMPTRDLDALMQDADYDFRQLTDPDVNYRFYKDLGIAVLIHDGVVSEMIISQIPKGPTGII
jgi:hypothetical protein